MGRESGEQKGGVAVKTGRFQVESVHTGRAMPAVRYGTEGEALIYVPSSGGDETEFESYGLDRVVAPWVDRGRLQFFSIDGCGPTTLFDPSLAPRERIDRYAAFERHVADELLPRVEEATGGATIGVVGASYGAFVAANLLFKYPERVNVACGLGGVYQMWHRLDGHHDDTVYFHTPLEYLPRLEDPRILAAIRNTRGITLFGAENDPWLPTTHQLTRILEQKKLPHRTLIHPAPADHNERWWRQQLPIFLSGKKDG
jgi:esterase/lipase superfamily enzyme